MTSYGERDTRQRKAYLRLRERYRRRGKEFVYIDESGFEPSVTRHYAYAPKGRRVYGLISGHRRPRTSLIGARMPQGFQAPLLLEDTCNAELFNRWLEHQLCPLLTEKHVVVMDNVPFHKGAKTRELIESKGATLLFLPPLLARPQPHRTRLRHYIKKIREYNEFETLDNIIKLYQ